MELYDTLARMSLAGYMVSTDMILIRPETKRNGDWEKVIEMAGIPIKEDERPIGNVKEIDDYFAREEFKRELRRARLKKLKKAAAEADRKKIVYKKLGVPMSEWEAAMMEYYRELFSGMKGIYQRGDFERHERI